MQYLYVTEGSFSRIIQFKISPTGVLSEKTPYAELPGFPGGIFIDEDQNFWVTLTFENSIAMVLKIKVTRYL